MAHYRPKYSLETLRLPATDEELAGQPCRTLQVKRFIHLASQAAPKSSYTRTRLFVQTVTHLHGVFENSPDPSSEVINLSALTCLMRCVENGKLRNFRSNNTYLFQATTWDAVATANNLSLPSDQHHLRILPWSYSLHGRIESPNPGERAYVVRNIDENYQRALNPDAYTKRNVLADIIAQQLFPGVTI
jgi:hypothetical protein